jgi:mRNA-degrading endonuclease toxin of MazEF toxin-antitoxin module
MRRGSIVWVEFPAGEGRAQSGRRPAVVFDKLSELLAAFDQLTGR